MNISYKTIGARKIFFSERMNNQEKCIELNTMYVNNPLNKKNLFIHIKQSQLIPKKNLNVKIVVSMQKQ